MKPFDQMEFHPISEKITDVLCKKVQNDNPEFFRILVSYYITRMASNMRTKIWARGRGIMPVNMYVINLAMSGWGKGYSQFIIENDILDKFTSTFNNVTVPAISEESLTALAAERANREDVDPDDMIPKVKKEHDDIGPYLTSVDSATTAATKQYRHKLLMSKIGAINFEIDEIGRNLVPNTEILPTLLELFDSGQTKTKLIKNTRDQQRNEEIRGCTPTNVLGFGEPTALLSGDKVTDEFIAYLKHGFARRCIFGYSVKKALKENRTADDIFNELNDPESNDLLNKISADFGLLAAVGNYDKTITIPDDLHKLFLEYRIACEERSDTMSIYDTTEKAEMDHRYAKAMKLAGAYAFVNQESSMSQESAENAIKLVEASGESFHRIINREGAYAKLAQYIADVGREVTHVDLTEELPFFKGAARDKKELLDSAIAWGYKNRIIIKRSYTYGIEFLSGETLKKVDLDNIRLGVSNDIAVNYQNTKQPFDKIGLMTQKPGFHWVNHHLKNGHRNKENAIPGFDIVVLDVDSGIAIKAVKALFKDYKGLLYTTKRHTPQTNRFRLVLPMQYRLELDDTNYEEFMQNIFEWLPFKVDDGSTKTRVAKWLTHKDYFEYLPGDQLLDPMPFIPKTTKNDERKKTMQDLKSLDNLERWFCQNTGDGNRSNQFIRYALMYVDMGADITTVRDKVIALNEKLPDSISEREIDTTIMSSVAKAIQKRP